MVIAQLTLTNRWLMTIGHNLGVQTQGNKIICNLDKLQTSARQLLDELPKYVLIKDPHLQNCLQEIVNAAPETPPEEVAFLYRELLHCRNNTITSIRL